MAGGCEVEACDLPAVGRCARCSTAFCYSHQAVTSSQRHLDRCSQCLRGDDQARLDERRRVQGLLERIRQAAAELSATGSRYALPKMRPKLKHGLFRFRTVNEPTGEVTFYVGRFMHHWTQATDPNEEFGTPTSGLRDTYVDDDGSLAPELQTDALVLELIANELDRMLREPTG